MGKISLGLGSLSLIIVIVSLGLTFSERADAFPIPITSTPSLSPTAIPTSHLLPAEPHFPPDGGYFISEFPDVQVIRPTVFSAQYYIFTISSDAIGGIRYRCLSVSGIQCPAGYENMYLPPPVVLPAGDYTWSLVGCRPLGCSQAIQSQFTVDRSITITATPTLELSQQSLDLITVDRPQVTPTPTQIP